MKRTYRFVAPSGSVVCSIDGAVVEIPVFAGIFKHPTVGQLQELLKDPVVVRKYTYAALRTAPWCALQRFPRAWLLACLADADVTVARRKALDFMLDASTDQASRT